MKIIKESKLLEGSAIVDYSIEGRVVQIQVNSLDVDTFLKFTNQTLKKYNGKLTKISDNVVAIPAKILIDFAIANLE